MPSYPKKQIQTKDMQFPQGIHFDSFLIDLRKQLIHAKMS